MKRWSLGLLAALTWALTATAETGEQLRYVELFQSQPVETGERVEVRGLRQLHELRFVLLCVGEQIA